ncbi:L-asparaginase [Priestia megaterium]|nr:L-asparaginase [Priestia megaterium]
MNIIYLIDCQVFLQKLSKGDVGFEKTIIVINWWNGRFT